MKIERFVIDFPIFTAVFYRRYFYLFIFSVVARQCQDACQIEGISIPSGMLVQANLWTLHQDPKHWGPDSDSFDPLRWDWNIVF